MIKTLAAHGLDVKILCEKGSVPGAENLRFQKDPHKLFQRHAVVGEEAGNGKGSRRQDADPACGFLADGIAKQQIQSSSNRYGTQRTNKLANRQPKEYGFFMLSYFLGDFYFDSVHLKMLGNLTSFL